MILFLVLSFAFYIMSQEADVKRTVKEPIKNYINGLNKSGILDEGVTFTSENDLFTKIFTDFNLTQIGSSYLVGSKNSIRINMRYYDVIENKNSATNGIFPVKIGSLSTIPTQIHSKQQAFDRQFIKNILQKLTGTIGELKETFKPITIPGLLNAPNSSQNNPNFVINERVYT